MISIVSMSMIHLKSMKMTELMIFGKINRFKSREYHRLMNEELMSYF